MRQSETSVDLGTNGRAIKMVPTTEVVKQITSSVRKDGVVNGSRKYVNGASIVKRARTSALVKRPKIKELDGLPPVEELKVLPTDEGFGWANDNYNSVQRSIDVWSFLISLRIRVLLENAEWAYFGGFSEENQVHRAILHNGEKVVVKVQRPSLKKLFDIDLQNLKLIAEYFQRSETLGGPRRDWMGIYEECATILYQEIDYTNEGKNADVSLGFSEC